MESSAKATHIPAPSAWGSPSAPWGKAAASPPPQSLEDVMSEELIQQLQAEDKTPVPTAQPAADYDPSFEVEVDSDFLLAQMLQHEFDKEHDLVLKKEEAKWNGTSKVTMSYEKYQVVHPADKSDDEEETWDDYEDEDVVTKEQKFGRGGVSGKGKSMVSKHDSDVCGKRNAQRASDRLPVNLDIGDLTKVKGCRLPNHVYNKLKLHSVSEGKYSHKVHEKKEHATADQVVDPRTRLILYKLVNNGLLDAVNGVISSGKESVVLHGEGGTKTEQLVPAEVAIKVFKTTLAEFKNRCQYMKGDVRFFKDQFKKQNPRKIIDMWSSKEEFNLQRMVRHGVPCPRVVVSRKHVLVLQFLGENRVAAPKLKDADLSASEVELAYAQCVENMKKMYNGSRLVHADLSEYNMLWYKGQVYFIDVAQAVDYMHPFAMEFLLRDCENVSRFFNQKGAHEVMTGHQLFNDVTGLDFEGEGGSFLAHQEEYDKNRDITKKEMMKTEDYPFDFFFDRAQKERLAKAEKAEGDDDGEEEAEDTGDEDDGEDSSDSDVDWEMVDKVVPDPCLLQTSTSSTDNTAPMGEPSSST